MDDNKVLELTGKIEETLGKDNFAMVADTVGEILTGNAENMKQLAERDAEIEKLKDRNEKLVAANGALLQKIPAGLDSKPKTEEKKEEKKIDLRTAFDKKGNFIR